MEDPRTSAENRRTRQSARMAIAMATLAVVIAGSIGYFGAQETLSFAYRLLRIASLLVAH
jgi:hypothetical protein